MPSGKDPDPDTIDHAYEYTPEPPSGWAENTKSLDPLGTNASNGFGVMVPANGFFDASSNIWIPLT